MPNFTLRLLITVAVFSAVASFATEQTRQLQEELRKRHLYYSDIDGLFNSELSAALRRYQARQGFYATGAPDEETLRSLGIIDEPAPPAEGTTQMLPDIPVLKSDAAVTLASRSAQSGTQLSLNPPAKNLEASRQEIQTFLRRYFDACQSPNPQDELAFYGDRVDFFDHGVVDRTYILNEAVAYDQRWPIRKYSFRNSLRISKSDGKIIAKFRVAFQVANSSGDRRATGRTDDTIAIARRGDAGFEIVSLREERVRQRPRLSGRPRRKPGEPGSALARSVNKVFKDIFGPRTPPPKKKRR